MDRGKSAETHSSPFVKLDSRGNVLHDAGSSHPELCDNLHGWDGTGVGGRLEGWGTGLVHDALWGRPTQYCGAVIFKLKIKNKLKKENRCLFLNSIKEKFRKVPQGVARMTLQSRHNIFRAKFSPLSVRSPSSQPWAAAERLPLKSWTPTRCRLPGLVCYFRCALSDRHPRQHGMRVHSITACSTAWRCQHLFVDLPVGGPLCHFQFGVIMNNCALNIWVCFFQ